MWHDKLLPFKFSRGSFSRPEKKENPMPTKDCIFLVNNHQYKIGESKLGKKRKRGRSFERIKVAAWPL
ncbi:hypothetical protein Leryth_026079 [Lithospermum erythrorhizon]|nr:hypothetical protein Leryth_026079 [Lithospermum erythrorhizon]